MDLKYYKRYCKDIENVENFEKAKADNFKGWDCHHRFETHNSDGERRLIDITVDELIALEMYYNRPASELIFMKENEHSSLHTKGKQGNRKGKQGYWKGKTGPNKGKQFSAETRNKMSLQKTGHHWYNDGKINILAKECPDGFTPGRLLK